MFFMSTACGRPHGGGGPAHVDACGQGGGGQKREFFVDVINGWPLTLNNEAIQYNADMSTCYFD